MTETKENLPQVTISTPEIKTQGISDVVSFFLPFHSAENN